MLDADAYGQDINDSVVVALDDNRRYASYLAAWFDQIAIVHYCPRHSDKIGTI